MLAINPGRYKIMHRNPFNRRPGASHPVAARSRWRRRHVLFGLEWLEDRVLPSLLSTFELDGNATTGVLGTSGSTTTSHDWDQVYNDFVVNPGQNTSGSIPGAVTFFHDQVNSPTDDIFTGGSSADINQIDQLLWKSGPAPQAKADIADIYAAAYSMPVAGGPNHAVVYFGADRINSQQGDTALGFWLFQN